MKVFAPLLAAAVATQAMVLPHARRAANDTAEYDYVVVGSGPGGGPLASRLAIAGHKVLLIEAGDDQGESYEYKVPAYQLKAQTTPSMAWDFYVQHYADWERQEQDSKMSWRLPSGEIYVGKTAPEGAERLGILYPRSGTLGGCGSHNALVTIYPFASDWEYIQSITGDSSWAPDNMRKYFERLEKCQYLPNSIIGHGFNGWLKTNLAPLTLVLEDQKLLSLVIGAAAAMGKGLLGTGLLGPLIGSVTGLTKILLGDANSAYPWRDGTEGLWQVPLSMNQDNVRSGPREFILETANAVNSDGSRKYHLDIQMLTLATKIRFDDSDVPKAIGVEYLTGQSLYAADPRYAGAQGTPGYVAAKKEVIVSGGAFNTPQILKLSGVGPKEELESFGIDVVKDLPGVGTNMQDRYEIGVTGEAPTDFTILDGCTFGNSFPDACLSKWENNGLSSFKGVYASSGVAVIVTKKSSVASRSEDPDILMLGVPGDFRGYVPSYDVDVVREHNHWAWASLKAHSHNRAGTVKLRSADPRDTPSIVFNSFDTGTTAGGGDQKDLQASYEGIQLARRMFDKTPAKFTEIWPGANVSTEAEVKQYIKDEAWGHHASCSVPIGADDDQMAVLDTNFRVRGVRGLRVVDASVFPKIPGTFVALPTYMISEKAADVIINGD